MKFPPSFIVLDTETGGTLPSIHALLSIGAAFVSFEPNGGMVLHSTYSRLIQPSPGKIIDAEAAAKNGYSPEAWVGAQPLAETMQNFTKWLRECLDADPEARLLAHCAGFDKAFLEQAAHETGTRLPIRHAWRCSMDKFGTLVDRRILPPGSLKLERLAQLAGLEQPPIHDAGVDALLCARCYQWLLTVEENHYAEKYSRP